MIPGSARHDSDVGYSGSRPILRADVWRSARRPRDVHNRPLVRSRWRRLRQATATKLRVARLESAVLADHVPLLWREWKQRLSG